MPNASAALTANPILDTVAGTTVLASASLVASPAVSASAISALPSAALAASPRLSGLATVPATNPEGAEVLRVYKYGSTAYTDVTSARQGGYTALSVSKVRNAPGSLDFTLEGTTLDMLHAWIDEVARVELWINGVRSGIYRVDSYRPRWSNLTCSVRCVGILADAKGVTFTGSFPASSIVSDVLRSLAEHAGLEVGTLFGSDYTVGALSYTEVPVFTAIEDLCRIASLDFFCDGNGRFSTAPTASSSTTTFTLNEDAWEFDTEFNARDVVNRLIITCEGRSWTFDETTSQSMYGIRTQSIEVSGVISDDDAYRHAQAVFSQYAYPFQQITITAPHDFSRSVGEMVRITGVETGRDYEQIIAQIDWSVGDLGDVIQIGVPPLTINPPTGVFPGDDDGGPPNPRYGNDEDFDPDSDTGVLARDPETGEQEWRDIGDTIIGGIAGGDPGDLLTIDDGGNLTWVDPTTVVQEGGGGSGGGGSGGGGLVRGVLTAYDALTHTCTFQPDGGGAAWTGVAVAEHIGTPSLGVPCWVGGSSG